MGPLADGRRKRLSSAITESIFSSVLSFFPPSKKQKLPPLPPPPPPPAPPQPVPAPPPQAPDAASVLPRLPPVVTAPATRSSIASRLHAPQRIISAFGLGSRPLAPRASLTRPQTPPEDKPLGLEEYAKLVSSVEEATPLPAPEKWPRKVAFVPIDDEVDVREVEEEDEDVEMEQVSDFRAIGKKGPSWKELYESSKRNHDGKIRSLDFEVKVEEERLLSLSLQRKAEEAKSKKEVPDVFVPLTEEEEDEVSHALRGGKSHEKLVFHEPSSIVITRGILRCLNYGAWLNDEVINLYLELLKERERREPKKFLKCHFFNTFFYKKLIGGNNGYDFKSVRRWTTQKKLGYELLECDKIFVPIHKEIHWCLAVINIKDKKLQYLDSLGGMDTTALGVLARYLTDEAKEKSGKQIDASSWKLDGVQGLPHQENGWDCGMFMLKYIDFYSRDMNLCFGQKHMEYFRKRTAKEILNLRAE